MPTFVEFDVGTLVHTRVSARTIMYVEIVEFDPRFARDFADLNYEWIETAYTVEEHDLN